MLNMPSQKTISLFKSKGVKKKIDKGVLFEMSHEHLYFLEEGILKIIQINKSGAQRVKYIIRKSEIFGGLYFLMRGEKKYTDYSVALEDSSLSMIHYSEIESYAKKNIEFEKYILKSLGERIIKIEKRLDAMIFGDSNERILRFIIEYVESYGEKVDGKIVAPNLLTHMEISTLTATSRQTVTKVFNLLRKKKVIDYNTHTIELLKTELDKDLFSH